MQSPANTPIKRPIFQHLDHRPACGQGKPQAADPAVSAVRQGDDADEALEAQIQAANDAMVEAQGRYQAGGGFEAMGDRDRAMAEFYALIKRRSPAQIERMRVAQAWRMTQEPGAGGPLA